jgi:restriction system protein
MNYLLAAAGGAVLAVLLQWIWTASAARAARSKWALRTDGSVRCFRGLIVRDGRGTTEIDEVVVTPAGVFVIEKKDFNAWIYGSGNDEYWTAVYKYGEKHRFQNPIRQNYRHLKALESLLRIPRPMLSSLVAFSDRSRLMTPMPREVVTSDYVTFVESQEDVVLSPEEFDTICDGLSMLEAQSDDSSVDRHVEDLHERFESTTRCPKCGGNLVKRQSRKPGYERNVFLGCSNYPSCKFVRNLDAT